MNNSINYLGQQPFKTNEAGKKIKHYVYNYCDIIGKGNFAKVYKGTNEKTKEIVAIKIVSLDSLKSKRLEELIFEEIRILQQMNHPNILKFYEALMSQRNCYIITELCNEGDLEEKIKKKQISSDKQFASITADIYQGLRYLREMRVTHRDLKTANIFMHNGRAKIADFGLAKFYKQNFKDLDIGSPLYMSPEGMICQVYGEKTDIWAFGIIIYQMIHGDTPFSTCVTEFDIKSSIVKPIPQFRFKKNISEHLRRLMNVLLEISETKRPNIFQLAEEPYIKGLFQSNQPLSNQSNQPQSNQLQSQVNQPQSFQLPNNSQSNSQKITNNYPTNYINNSHLPVNQFTYDNKPIKIINPTHNPSQNIQASSNAPQFHQPSHFISSSQKTEQIVQPIVPTHRSANNFIVRPQMGSLEVPKIIGLNKSVDHNTPKKQTFQFQTCRDEKKSTIHLKNNEISTHSQIVFLKKPVLQTPQINQINQINQIKPAQSNSPNQLNYQSNNQWIFSNKNSGEGEMLKAFKRSQISEKTIESSKQSENDSSYFLSRAHYTTKPF